MVSITRFVDFENYVGAICVTFEVLARSKFKILIIPDSDNTTFYKAFCIDCTPGSVGAVSD